VVALITQNDLRKVQNLPFCYLCGKKFLSDALTDRDHVPPESVFAKSDRQPVVLKTHEVCNHRYSADDEKVGQLVALKHGKAPAHPQNRRLQIVHSGRLGMGAVSNLNVEQAIWGWIAGFHAALYGEPLLGARGSISTGGIPLFPSCRSTSYSCKRSKSSGCARLLIEFRLTTESSFTSVLGAKRTTARLGSAYLPLIFMIGKTLAARRYTLRADVLAVIA
jgi:hypothetical protein